MRLNRAQLLTVSGIIFAAALSRLLPHPPNAAPIAAMALFAGAYAQDKRLAFGLPLAAMLLSDAVIGFHPGMFAVYVSFMLITCLGLKLRNRVRALPVAGASLASSVLFFLLTNSVWLHGGHGLFPMNFQGMIDCYVTALPFFANTLFGDLFFTALLFGGYAALRRRFPTLRSAAA
jgi:hypothetical protein